MSDGERYRYTVRVVEGRNVEAFVESDVQLGWQDIKRLAEEQFVGRRKRGYSVVAQYVIAVARLSDGKELGRV